MSSSGRMHVSRPKSSKGRSRPMMTPTSCVDPPSQSSSLSPQPPATKTNDRLNQCLRSRAILRRCSQPSTDMLTEIFDGPPDGSVSLNKYSVLPSIEKKTGTDRTHGQGDSSRRICQHAPRVHTKVRPVATSGSQAGLAPPEEPGLLLAIRTPCGQRFKSHFRPADPLQTVLSAAEAEFGERFDNCLIETMDVPRRTFANLTMTLAQCGIQNKSVLCISQDDSNTDLT
ncbi:UBX domain-containing protein 10 [Puntigrus tetrazona]|uniref:UBX domain-containing protein 10 n=1 Tax=Puntigrus tetrazona TaxID=1606681 RepID=UPI001C8A689E|nr:UBX domain-containing protein 10 [Puntigrus tetrazona]